MHTALPCAALAATLAACVSEPRVLRVSAGDELAAVAYDVRLERGDAARCERFAADEIALPDDRVAAGDHIVVTAVDAAGAPTGVGELIVDDGDLAIALTAVERPVPRGISDGSLLSPDGRSAGRQLAVTPSGAVAAVWHDRNHDLLLLGRRLDGPRDSLDRGLPTIIDDNRASPAIAPIGERFATAWTLRQREVRAHVLDADLAPINPYGDMPIFEAAEGDILLDPQLIPAGDRVLAVWTVIGPGQFTQGRLGTRWLSIVDDAIEVGPVAFLGEPGAKQYGAAGAMLPSGDVVIGWVEDPSPVTFEIRLARVPRDGAPLLAGAVTLDVAGDLVNTLAMAPAGDQVAVAWSTVGRGGSSIHLARVDAALAVVGDVIDLGRQQPAGQIALASRGAVGLVAAWWEQSPSGVATTWLRWLGPDGVPAGPPRRAGLVPGGDQRTVSVAANAADVVAVVWQQGAAPDRDAGIVGRLVRSSDSSAAPAPCQVPAAAP
jgi:hypothetical protein